MQRLDIQNIFDLKPGDIKLEIHSKNRGEPFSGYHADQCINYNQFAPTFEVVVVSGSGPNICGHALLCINRQYYFHTDAFHAPPKVMNSIGYKEYLRTNNKLEFGRINVKVSNPKAIFAKLSQLSIENWSWLGLWHNCYSFVEAVLEPGKLENAINFNVMFYDINCPRRHLIIHNHMRKIFQ